MSSYFIGEVIEVTTKAYANGNTDGNIDMSIQIPVIDYEGSAYRTDFWDGQGRDYEDMVERSVLTRLLPSPHWQKGKRIAEIGAGFGRLADMYTGYDQIILFDYSSTLLQDAARQWGHDERFVFVAGNIYDLPFATSVLDTLVMVRVMHHLADVPSALEQLKRVMNNDGIGILEYANKRNLKAILRWAAQRQDWSPFDSLPIEFVKLNFDFHPKWMSTQLDQVGYHCMQRLAVSHFRLPFLKSRIRPETLTQFDQYLFDIGGRFPISPSVFLQVEIKDDAQHKEIKAHTGEAEILANSVENVQSAYTENTHSTSRYTETNQTSLAQLFRCPVCFSKSNTANLQPKENVEEHITAQHTLVLHKEDHMKCTLCNSDYLRQGLVWDFKTALL